MWLNQIGLKASDQLRYIPRCQLLLEAGPNLGHILGNLECWTRTGQDLPISSGSEKLGPHTRYSTRTRFSGVSWNRQIQAHIHMCAHMHARTHLCGALLPLVLQIHLGPLIIQIACLAVQIFHRGNCLRGRGALVLCTQPRYARAQS